MLPATQTWWETLWASPVSSQFRDIDLPGLVRVALLWEKVVERKASAAELGELRQLETSFGLTPAARVRLGWKFADELPESQSGTSAKTKTTRRRMRAV